MSSFSASRSHGGAAAKRRLNSTAAGKCRLYLDGSSMNHVIYIDNVLATSNDQNDEDSIV